jgi:hypothetical protein
MVVLVIAAVYTMIHLDRDPAAKLEKDPKAAVAEVEGDAEIRGEPGDEALPEGSPAPGAAPPGSSPPSSAD